MTIVNHRDFWSGVMFLVIGLLFAVLSLQYQVGTAAKMGPGYFPLVLGGLMAVLGLIIMLGGMSKRSAPGPLEKVGWKELFLVLISVAVFASLLNVAGVVIALFAMILVASLASHEFKLGQTILISIVLIILAYLIFVLGLELQFSVWPPALSR